MAQHKSYLDLRNVNLSAEQLEQRARELSAMRIGKRTLHGLEDISFYIEKSKLLAAYKSLSDLSAYEAELPVAVDCFLEEFYVIEKAVFSLDSLLDNKYYRDLPVCLDQPYKGLPRVYRIAAQLVGYSAGAINQARLTAYINAFQENSPLKMNEIWALCDMLKVALLKTIYRTVKECLSLVRTNAKAHATALEILSLIHI